MTTRALARHAKKRDANEPDIRKALHKAGVQTWPLDKPMDLLCFWRKQFFLLEVKNPDGKNRVEESQQEFMEATIGGLRGVVHSPAEALRFARLM